jgi:GPH family glycoside/pentoside/hexuronide:cation symporter
VPALNRLQLFAYGGLGLPLAFAALPMFVHIVPFYSAYLSLGMLGAILLGLRIFDAVIDPVIGLLFDRFPRPRLMIAFALPPLAIGWVALFHPPATGSVVPWLIATLLLTTVGYSLATVVHTTWGARIHPELHQRARAFAAREGSGLIGVIIAAALPLWLAPDLASGLQKMAYVFVPLLIVLGVYTLVASPGMHGATPAVLPRHLLRPFANPAFAHFVPGFLLNGVAAALPATLVIFFIDDVLHLHAWSGLFLGLYFISGAAGLPLWVALARRIGTLDAWLCSMLLAVLTFAGAYWLGSGALIGFAVVCIASGLALGADLALPSALVAGYIDDDAQPQPGAYYGLMSFFTKLTLALAAGLALPLLQLAGYHPGDNQTAALSASYALLPCALKIAALLWFKFYRPVSQAVLPKEGVTPC